MKLKSLFAAAAVLAGVPGAARAAEVLKNDHTTLDVGGRLQLLGFGQKVDDAYRNDARMYLFLKQARLQMQGNVDDWRFKLSLAMGGEVEVKAPSPGVALNLLDLYVDIPTFVPNTYVRAGQFKVPYSRERLIDSDSILFAERSISNLTFRMGRDVGAAAYTNQGPFAAGLGVFTAGGGSVPQRFLPENLGIPMVALRLGVDSSGVENIFAEGVRSAQAEKPEGAFFLNAFYVKDSQVGHSTVFNTRPQEKNLLLNSNWNPYLAQSPTQLGRLWQVGGDLSGRAPAGPGTVSGELEGNFAVYQNTYGDIRVPGARAQVAYAFEAFPVTAALRYAAIRPDKDFRVGASQVTGTQLMQEVTPSLQYVFKGAHVRLVGDLPVQVNVPVVTEENIGAYLLTEQPDQSALLAKNMPVARQNVVEARLMLQASF
ncbi:hypothetical protein FGE12_25105 [Aggregicoccus sp. 17bor-14]|uniref:porin n=1 Tax=Myxococcaceae TaxID=31 RepID=UPI00129C1608|nr:MULTISPECIES: porin [Myxococcaceae]MBF5045710.1 hypothetical protein [Simulacricoccus sp. 17bor-14]MRI91446.1 hypothetical protein [Aggregicoccus sp. 17bor-14]